MKKLIAFIISLLLLCGCSTPVPKLTKEEYKDPVYSAWREFADGTRDYLSVALDSLNNAEEIKQACDKMSSAFEKFEKISPPEEFEEQHKGLLKSI